MPRGTTAHAASTEATSPAASHPVTNNTCGATLADSTTCSFTVTVTCQPRCGTLTTTWANTRPGGLAVKFQAGIGPYQCAYEL